MDQQFLSLRNLTHTEYAKRRRIEGFPLLHIDALEYNFIDSSDFEAPKQTQYHKEEIPEKCMTILDDGSLRLSPRSSGKRFLPVKARRTRPALNLSAMRTV